MLIHCLHGCSLLTHTQHGCSKTHIVIEVAIQAQNVRVSEMRLDLHLSTQLVLYIGVTKLIFEQDLRFVQEASI